MINITPPTKPITTHESKKVFSFCLYGTARKYMQGMLENIRDIGKLFPDWFIYIYHGDIDTAPFKIHSNVVLIKAKYTAAHIMLDRFVAIDDPDVSIMMVRDADSRINTRDEWCIRQFLDSSALFHIVRDHPEHCWFILGGLWGIKKGCIRHFSFRKAIDIYRKSNNDRNAFDQFFLRDIVYPKVVSNALIHGTIAISSDEHPIKIPFPYNKIFCGQPIEYNQDGSTYVSLKDLNRLL